MSVHLTDDEIVALCGLLGLSWPFPLPSVELEPQELAAASRRGIRSLTVRALLGVDATSDEPGLNAEVSAAVSSVANGSPLLLSAVIDESGVLLASSSGAYVVQGPDGAGVLATTTSTGIHVISTSSITEAREAFVALVDNALTAGLAGGEGSRLLAMKVGGGGEALAVAQGAVTIGLVTSESTFASANGPEVGWDRTRLNRHLAA